MIAFCGLDCSLCEAFVAYKSDDGDLRKKTAQKWTERYRKTGRNRPPVKAQDVNCAGCFSDGPLYLYCSECKVRICGLEKEVENCGLCDEYETCEKISRLHQVITSGKEVCDRMRRERSK